MYSFFPDLELFCATVFRGTKPNVLSSVLISIMWILITAHAIVRWILTDGAFIRHADSREDQMRAIISKQLSLDLTGYIVSFLSVLFADTTMVRHNSNIHREILILFTDLAMLGTSWATLDRRYHTYALTYAWDRYVCSSQCPLLS